MLIRLMNNLWITKGQNMELKNEIKQRLIIRSKAIDVLSKNDLEILVLELEVIALKYAKDEVIRYHKGLEKKLFGDNVSHINKGF